MTFKLSQRSRSNLIGGAPRLVAVVEHAIGVTKVDFAVTEGVRTAERQHELFLAGASQISGRSKHVQGEAVDLVAFLGKRVSWELPLYDDIADAMRAAALELGVGVRWGAAWNVPDIRYWEDTMEQAVSYYVGARRASGLRPFIDGPHFELT